MTAILRALALVAAAGTLALPSLAQQPATPGMGAKGTSPARVTPRSRRSPAHGARR